MLMPIPFRFELSLFGQRVVVNSGTSQYGLGAERLRQRGTAAHSTVEVDGADSSEVWGGFRVARRARPFGLAITDEDQGLKVICAHDGYRRLEGQANSPSALVAGQHSLQVSDSSRATSAWRWPATICTRRCSGNRAKVRQGNSSCPLGRL
jgi:uncharacterized heparinase superfamily protein